MTLRDATLGCPFFSPIYVRAGQRLFLCSFWTGLTTFGRFFYSFILFRSDGCIYWWQASLATAIIFLAPISAFDQVSVIAISIWSYWPICLLSLASIWKKIRVRIGLTIHYSYSRQYARTNFWVGRTLSFYWIRYETRSSVSNLIRLVFGNKKQRHIMRNHRVLRMMTDTSFTFPYRPICCDKNLPLASKSGNSASGLPTLQFNPFLIFAHLSFRWSITSYGDRPNSYQDVAEYFRAHFLQVHRRNDISKRALYAVSTLASVLTSLSCKRILMHILMLLSISHRCWCVHCPFIISRQTAFLGVVLFKDIPIWRSYFTGYQSNSKDYCKWWALPPISLGSWRWLVCYYFSRRSYHPLVHYRCRSHLNAIRRCFLFSVQWIWVRARIWTGFSLSSRLFFLV